MAIRPDGQTTAPPDGPGPSRPPLHFGWVMVGLGFLYAVFSSSALGVPGVLILPMSKDLGLSLGELSAPQGLRLALFGLSAPFAGGLVLRYGLKRMLVVSGVMILAGLALTLRMSGPWDLWLGTGILLGVGPGIVAMQLGAVISSRWFVAHRGLVVGILSGAVATGMLIFMPLAAWITEHWGWRAALMPSTIGTLLSLVLYAWFARERPQDMGLPAVGDTTVQPAPAPVRVNFVRLSFQALSLGVQRPVFWVLTFTFFICGVSSFGLTQAHLVPFCSDRGVPLVAAAWMLAVIGICDLIGTVGSGWLSDRYDNRWLLTGYYGLRGVALLWLVNSDMSMVGLSVFAVIYGLDFIATLPPSVRLTVTSFGRDMGPAVFSWIFCAHHVGAGLTAYLTGVSRDVLGTYGPAFATAGVLCLVAAAAFVVTRPGAPGDGLPTQRLA